MQRSNHWMFRRAQPPVAARERTLRSAFAALALLWLSAQPALAHDFAITDTLCVLKNDGVYVIDMTVDVDALALGVAPTTESFLVAAELEKLAPADFDAALARARETIARRVRVRFDGIEVAPLISFPEHRTSLATSSAIPTVIGTTARLTGRVPALARTLTFGASKSFNVVYLTIFDQRNGAVQRHLLGASEDSPPYVLVAPDGAASQPAAGDRMANVARFLWLGFEHILPKGLDHILFVVGLFLFSNRLAPLLWQVTAFTVAHSVTLALSIFEVVAAPSWIVESLIALSIAYVAVENVLTTEMKPWRPALVFAFGLLHGLGFAGVLRELGLPQEDMLAALLSFNVGVELGQIAVVAVAFLLVGWARHSPQYRKLVVIPLSAIIALVGLFWTVQRAAPALLS